LRLLRHPLMRELDPVLVAGEEGWLTRECVREGLSHIVEEFPSSRSLSARLFGNRAFARRVAGRLNEKIFLVHGNDHLEGLLTQAVGEALGAKTALFLRSPTMTQDDYDKYRCREADLVAAVGEMLRGFDPRTVVIPDGLEPAEFLPPKPPAAAFPARILVIGSAVEWKGWKEAFAVAARFPQVKFCFTSNGENRDNLEFLGRVEGFRDLVRSFDLALNPSWHESFGMAALEVLAAGVPLLSTRCSGVIEQAVGDERWLARPRDAADLGARLAGLQADWRSLDVAACQERSRGRFMIDHTAQKLRRAYAALFAGQDGAEHFADPRVVQ
jgi:glycosyltransferase involved in cell wall biosynthesis